MMRIVWKDSNPKGHTPIKYRNYFIEGSHDGWTVNIPGDNNLYKNRNSALNVIDEYLGGFGRAGYAKRKEFGIQIVNQKEEGLSS